MSAYSEDLENDDDLIGDAGEETEVEVTEDDDDGDDYYEEDDVEDDEFYCAQCDTENRCHWCYFCPVCDGHLISCPEAVENDPRLKVSEGL